MLGMYTVHLEINSTAFPISNNLSQYQKLLFHTSRWTEVPPVKMLVAFPTIAGTIPAIFAPKKGACGYSQDQNVTATRSISLLFSKLDKVAKNACQHFIRKIKLLI